MAIEIVDLPIKNGDFPQLCKRLPEGSSCRMLWPSIWTWWFFKAAFGSSCGDFIGQSGSPAQSTRFLILLQDTVEMEPWTMNLTVLGLGLHHFTGVIKENAPQYHINGLVQETI